MFNEAIMSGKRTQLHNIVDFRRVLSLPAKHNRQQSPGQSASEQLVIAYHCANSTHRKASEVLDPTHAMFHFHNQSLLHRSDQGRQGHVDARGFTG